MKHPHRQNSRRATKELFRIASLTLVSALGIAAANVVSASAAECPGTGEGVALCSGGHVLEGTFPFTGKRIPGTGAEYEVEGIVKVECTGITTKGEFVATKTMVEARNVVIANNGCTLNGHANCTVKPLVFGLGSGLKGTFANVSEVTWSSQTSEPFAEISITNCLQEFHAKVVGSRACKWTNGTTEATIHKDECYTGNNLRTSTGKIVYFSWSEELALTSGKAFSFQHG
jgi:hypothetical protein